MTTTITAPDAYRLGAGAGERLWITGDTMSIKATKASTGGRLTIVEVEASPGSGPPPHVHEHEDEAFYAVDGEFELQIGDDVRPLRPGGFAYVPSGTVHRFSCTSPEGGRILIVFSPGGMDEFFRAAGWPALDDGPAPPVDADEIARTEVAAARAGLRVVTWG